MQDELFSVAGFYCLCDEYGRGEEEPPVAGARDASHGSAREDGSWSSGMLKSLSARLALSSASSLWTSRSITERCLWIME